MVVYPTFVKFITDIRKAFRSADREQDALNKLEALKQGNKTAEEIVTEFRHLVGQAGLEQKTRSDNINLIGRFRKVLNPALSRRILFGDVVPKTIEGWIDKAIQFDTQYRMAMIMTGQSLGKTRTDKKTTPSWYKPAEKKDPNAMDVDALTMEERQTLMKQGKCFKCKKHGHRAADCPPPTGSKPKKDADPVETTYANIRAFTKDQRDAFMKKMMDNEDSTDF